MSGRLRGLFSLLLVASSLVLLPASPAAAAGVVGTGSPASCTEAALDAALAGGGSVTFNCGAGLVTIGLTSEKVISADTQIDGGGKVTLDGQGQTRIFYVNPGVSFDLSRITLTGGNSVGVSDSEDGGAIYSDDGIVTLIGATVSGNAAEDDGGGLYSSGGTVTLIDSSIINNTADSNGGGIRVSGATVAIVGSTIADNTAGNDGGGIRGVGGTLTVTNSRISGNSAGDDGGGLFTGGSQTISESVVSGNRAGDLGGGLYLQGQPTITKTTIDSNTANRGGGIYKRIGSPVTIDESTLSNNVARDDGGGIFVDKVPVTATNTTFSGNSAGDDGGAIFNAPDRRFTLINSTLSNNSAGDLGGGIFVAGGDARPQRTIFANNHSGGNCSGAIVSVDYNLSDDGTCNLNRPNDLSNTPAGLAPLGNYGGPTQTHHPLQTSAAIDSSTCVEPNDQRGIARPQGADCDRGSVEVVPVTPVELTALCLNFYTGAVTSPTNGQCGGGTWQIDLPSPFPLNICISSFTGHLSFTFTGACGAGQILHVVPDDGDLLLCWSQFTGALRTITDPVYCTFGDGVVAVIRGNI